MRNLLARLTLKPRSQQKYLLEVNDTTPVSKTASKTRVKGGFKPFRKLATVVALSATLLAGGGVATAATMADQKDANAFIDAMFANIVCTTQDSPEAFLGGKNVTLTNGLANAKENSPVGAGLNITFPANSKLETGGSATAGSQWTALEQYGYYAPNFEPWMGRYLTDSERNGDRPAAFIGTGGAGKDSRVLGPAVGVEDALNNPMFNSNPGGCMNMGGSINSGVGNAFLGLTKLAVALASETYGLSVGMNLTTPGNQLYEIGEAVKVLITGDATTDGLKQILYLDWLLVIVILAALWMFWQGVVKRQALASTQGGIWMLGAVVGGVLLLSNPMWVPGLVNQTMAKFNDSVISTIAPGASNEYLCSTGGSGGNAAINGVRSMKCAIWYTTVYSPWVKGQFGVQEFNLAKNKTTDPNLAFMYTDAYDAGDIKGIDSFEGKMNEMDPKPQKGSATGSRGVFAQSNIKFGDVAYTGQMNWAIYMLDRQNNWKATNGEDISEVAFSQLAVNKNAHWRDASDAVGSSGMALLSSIGPVVLLTVVGFTQIGYQLSLLFLVLFAPLLFLIGIAPGFGRRIAMRWVELMAGLLVKSVVLILFIALYVRIYMTVVSLEMDWWVQMILIAALSFIGISQKDRITSMLNGAINFGGDKRLDAGESVGKSLAGTTSRALRTGSKEIKRARDNHKISAYNKQAKTQSRPAPGNTSRPDGSDPNADPASGNLGGPGKGGAGGPQGRFGGPNNTPDIDRGEPARLNDENHEHWQQTRADTADWDQFTPEERERVGMVDENGNLVSIDPDQAEEFLEHKKQEFIERENANAALIAEIDERKAQAEANYKAGKLNGKDYRTEMQYAYARRNSAQEEAKELRKQTEQIFGKKKTNDQVAREHLHDKTLGKATLRTKTDKPTYYARAKRDGQTWRKNNGKGSVNYAEGTGKTQAPGYQPTSNNDQAPTIPKPNPYYSSPFGGNNGGETLRIPTPEPQVKETQYLPVNPGSAGEPVTGWDKFSPERTNGGDYSTGYSSAPQAPSEPQARRTTGVGAGTPNSAPESSKPAPRVPQTPPASQPRSNPPVAPLQRIHKPDYEPIIYVPETPADNAPQPTNSQMPQQPKKQAPAAQKKTVEDPAVKQKRDFELREAQRKMAQAQQNRGGDRR